MRKRARRKSVVSLCCAEECGGRSRLHMIERRGAGTERACARRVAAYYIAKSDGG